MSRPPRARHRPEVRSSRREALEDCDRVAAEFCRLQSIGLQIAQGFHLSRPLTVDDVPRFLAGWVHEKPALTAGTARS